ncbi:hypothetical protein PaG_00925 [Moesziomyces aphidis]|uniref:BTB domain-containing protein n=1 Tax=Moesziomyces aphidis TaxID=84754 RepID=W3VS57_MOEAP|nr:hypothetical protein PaG_00925 [Moesziomyces aphidis]
MNPPPASFATNPVPALIARRTTVLAPPSLSTINHLDGATHPAGRNAGTSATRAAQERRVAGSQAPPRVSHTHHRSDLQQAVSQPTAAVPISTRENISTSKSWSSGLALKNANYPTATASSTHHEFVLHPTFRSDAEHRGDVLVRVEGVDFFVHKHILLFSSPFFASVLLGEWKESRLSTLLDDDELADAADAAGSADDSPAEVEANQTQESPVCNEDPQADGIVSASDTASPAVANLALQAQALEGNDAATVERVVVHPEPSTDKLALDAEAGDVQDPDHLVTDSRRRSLLRASYHTALWSQEDAATSSCSIVDSPLPAGSSAEDSGLTAQSADEGSADEGASVSGTDEDGDAVQRSEAADAERQERKQAAAESRRVRSKSKHLAARLTLRKLESASKLQTIPTRSTSKTGSSLVAVATQGARSSDASPLARLESLATPPLSRRASCEVGATPPPEAPAGQGFDESRVAAEERTEQRGGGGRGGRYRGVVAVVELEEEAAGTFHDFLFHIYPHLDLAVTWWNCGPLLRFADKFQVPYLRRSCVNFLRAALAGRPIEAMRLAELHGMDDLYKEASRHVLDNFAAWEVEELECLSKETLLKLERKRTWFLERLLKLGLANPARDYECHASCADPQTCARLLHDKWQSAYANAFRFSPPQPSVIFRHLRELDNASVLHMSACQSAARSWVQGLFDRMFSLGTLHTPRQFLAIKLEPPTKTPHTL